MEYEAQAARLGGFIKASREKPAEQQHASSFIPYLATHFKKFKSLFNRRKTP
jgi:hypothetical protein